MIESKKGRSKALIRDIEEFRSSVLKLDAIELLGLLRFFNLSDKMEDTEEIVGNVMKMITKFEELNRAQRRNLLRLVKAAVK